MPRPGGKSDTTLVSASSQKLANEPMAVDIFALDGDSLSPSKPIALHIAGMIRWFLGGWREKTLQALSPWAARCLLKQFVASRFQAIITNVNFRLTYRSVDPFSLKERESYRAAYLTLKLLAVPTDDCEVSIRAWKLRLDMIRTVIQSNTSLLASQWHKHAARRLFEELDDLQAYCYQPESLKEVLFVKSSLTERLALEMGERGVLSAPTSGPVMSGIRIVAALCNDLAYGEGSHAVQSMLVRISHTEWGFRELQKLEKEGPLLLHCAKRLVVDFQNPFAATVAFRLLYQVEAPEIHGVLTGPDGIGRLVTSFGALVATREYTNYRAFNYQTNRNLRSVCIALQAACSAGYIASLLEQHDFFTSLATLLDHFNQRDERVMERIAEEGCEDLDMKHDQDAVHCLINSLGAHERAKHALTEVNVYDKLQTFLCHPIRAFMLTRLGPVPVPCW